MSFPAITSCNGDMSERVMNTLQTFCPEVEIYSIDEAFLDLTGLPKNLNLLDYARHIRETVGMWTGIPVSIGVAPTKILAKVANYYAKRNHELDGVRALLPSRT